MLFIGWEQDVKNPIHYQIVMIQSEGSVADQRLPEGNDDVIESIYEEVAYMIYIYLQYDDVKAEESQLFNYVPQQVSVIHNLIFL